MKKIQYLLLSIFLVGLFLPTSVTAAPMAAATNTLTTDDVTLYPNEPYNETFAIVTNDNFVADWYWEANFPTQLDSIDKYGTSTAVLSNILKDQLAYKKIMQYPKINAQRVPNPWNAEWYRMKNTTLDFPTNYTTNMTFDYDSLGVLEVDSSVAFTSSGRTMMLQLAVREAGLHMLTYDNDIALTFILLDPNGNQITPSAVNYPSIKHTTQTLQQMQVFMAENTGAYQLFFTTANRFVELNFEMYNEFEELKQDELLVMEEVAKEDINPEKLLGTASFSIKIYTIEAMSGDYLRLNFGLIHGNPTIRLAQKTGNILTMSALTTTGVDNNIFVSQTGTVYIIVINNNYYRWGASADTPYIQPMKYRLFYTQFPKETLPLDTNQEISVTPETGAKLMSFEINTTKTIHFNSTVTDGTVTFVGADANNRFFRLDENYGRIYIPRIDVTVTGDSYLFEPGKYYFELNGNDTYYPANIIKIQTVTSQPISVSHSELSYVNQNPTSMSGTPISFQSIWSTSAQAQYYPQVGNITYNNWIKPGFNVSLWRSDNPGLFNQRLMDAYQLWIWNGSEYINQTFNTINLDLLINGSANTRPAFIGASQWFDSIDIKIGNTSADYNIQWYYMSAINTYRALNTTTGFSDGTLVDNRTLGKSGVVRFDPSYIDNDFGWAALSDPSTTMPNVNRTMYWIAIRASAESIAGIPSVAGYISGDEQIKLNKYVEAQIQITNNVILRSEYDTYMPVLLNAIDRTLTVNQVDEFASTDIESSITSDWWSNNGFGYNLIYPYSVGQRNIDSGSYVQYNGTLILRVQSVNDNGWYVSSSYGAEIGNISQRSETVNLTTYSTFGYSTSLNCTEYAGILLYVNSSASIDWYQFITNTTNATGCDIKALFNTPWYMNGLPTEDSAAIIMTTADDWGEMGIPMKEFWLLIEPTESVTDEPVILNLNIAKFNIKVITLSATPPTLPKGPLPEWVLPTAIGGGSALVVGIVLGVVFYKKKHPI